MFDTAGCLLFRVSPTCLVSSLELLVARVNHVHRDGKEERVTEAHAFAGSGLLTVAEVAATMRVSNMTVYRLIKSGDLAAVRVGKSYRIRESDVQRYLDERSVHVEGR
jgi:excisionase family DNA binding protein